MPLSLLIAVLSFLVSYTVALPFSSRASSVVAVHHGLDVSSTLTYMALPGPKITKPLPRPLPPAQVYIPAGVGHPPPTSGVSPRIQNFSNSQSFQASHSPQDGSLTGKTIMAIIVCLALSTILFCALSFLRRWKPAPSPRVIHVTHFLTIKTEPLDFELPPSPLPSPSLYATAGSTPEPEVIVQEVDEPDEAQASTEMKMETPPPHSRSCSPLVCLSPGSVTVSDEIASNRASRSSSPRVG